VNGPTPSRSAVEDEGRNPQRIVTVLERTDESRVAT